MRRVGRGRAGLPGALPGVLLAALLAGCAPVENALSAQPWFQTPSIVRAAGERAAVVESLWWYLFWVALTVFVVVTAAFLVGVRRRGRVARRREELHDAESGVGALLVGATVLTAALLLLTSVLTYRVMAEIDVPEEPVAATFEVVGKQFWWEVRLDDTVVSANELRIPVGRPVLVRLRSDNVIHSFWVPQLSGKLDLIPGQDNALWLQADAPGVYRGQCAEYCGVQHGNMAFFVVAEPEAQWRAWREAALSAPAAPADEEAQRGREVFEARACAACHAVAGTSASGTFGPDLTRVGSRLTLGAGTLLNTPANMARWITATQEVKPGALMPSQDLGADDLRAVVAYLQGLR